MQDQKHRLRITGGKVGCAAHSICFGISATAASVGPQVPVAIQCRKKLVGANCLRIPGAKKNSEMPPRINSRRVAIQVAKIIMDQSSARSRKEAISKRVIFSEIIP